MGDLQGKFVYKHQPSKMAAIEAKWETEAYPASFVLFAIPSQGDQKNHYEIKIPAALGIINGGIVKGTKEVILDNEKRIQNGVLAYAYLKQYKATKSPEAKANFEKFVGDLGYALLLTRNGADIAKATKEDIKKAALNSVPKTLPLFLSFRLMVGLGLLFLGYFVLVYYMNIKGTFIKSKFMQYIAILMVPLPWIAIFAGWFVAEYGRQPWVIQDILPTFKAASGLSASSIFYSLSGFFIIYTVLIIIDLMLMVRQIRKGPDNKSI
jgi:cytochrome d ubiquinol oxidase subunit I